MPPERPRQHAPKRYERLVPIALVTVTVVVNLLIVLTLVIVLGVLPLSSSLHGET